MDDISCYSLSGYLLLKPFGGEFYFIISIFYFHILIIALSLVLPTRRYWCAFNESIHTLEFYHSERDLINNKIPIESIQLYRTAITLSTTEEHVFIILYVNGSYFDKCSFFFLIFLNTYLF